MPMLDDEVLPMSWWDRLWRVGLSWPKRPAQPCPVETADRVADARPCTQPHSAVCVAPADADGVVLRWLLGSATEATEPSDDAADQALRRLDALLDDPAGQAALLPRPAAVLPRLLACLRRDSGSVPELARLVAQDVALVAEVMRLANSSFYRRAAAIAELDAAIHLLGVAGLRAAIARTVLKPMIAERGAGLTAAVAERLWQHTDRLAQLALGSAVRHGVDDFEAYLLGLVHTAAWSPVLRALDGSTGWPAAPQRVQALADRRDRLFAAIARQARFSDALTRAATDVAEHGVWKAPSSAAGLLRAACQGAAAHCLPEPAPMPRLAQRQQTAPAVSG